MPNLARQLLSEALGDTPVDRRIFGHEKDGRLANRVLQTTASNVGISKVLPVSFALGRGSIDLIGHGQEGLSVILASAEVIRSALCEKWGATRFEMRTGNYTIRQSSNLITYSTHVMIVSTKRDFINHMREKLPLGPTLDDLKPSIVRLIAGGILAYSDLLEDNGIQSADQIPVGLESEVHVLGGEVFEANKKKRVPVLGVRNLVFALPIKIDGPVMCGKLRSYGYGLIVDYNDKIATARKAA